MTKLQQENNQSEQKVRIDKWLWAARFYKTRALARDMVQGGKVHYNGQRCNLVKRLKSVQLSSWLKAMKKKK